MVVCPFYSYRSYLAAARVSAGDLPGGYEVRRDDRHFYLGNRALQSSAQAAVDLLDSLANPGESLLVGPADLSRTVYSDVAFSHLFPQLEPAPHFIEMDPGLGGLPEIAPGAPGYCSVLPNSMSPLAQTLKLNGYSTAQFGKCHEVPVWEASPVGPFNAWPTGGGGFEYFYGFICGETNQYYPTLHEGTTPVEPTKTPEEGYHVTEDLANHAIDWVRRQKSLMPDKPGLMDFPPGATPPPHPAPTAPQVVDYSSPTFHH